MNSQLDLFESSPKTYLFTYNVNMRKTHIKLEQFTEPELYNQFTTDGVLLSINNFRLRSIFNIKKLQTTLHINNDVLIVKSSYTNTNICFSLSKIYLR